jgi:UDP:flavonoid glycosyltransferase YjiC (YdhE family)
MIEGSAVVFGSPVAVGHVRPLIPLARRLTKRGLRVVWAISGDDNEPAAVWQKPLGELGVHFVDLDQTARFSRGTTPDFVTMSAASLFRRIVARANDVADAAAEAIRGAVGERPILCGIYDYFALWSYVAMRRLGVSNIDAVISAFPVVIDAMPAAMFQDPIYLRELAQLRARGLRWLEELPRSGVIPRDPGLRVLSFTSPALCPQAPEGIRLLGEEPDVLPHVEEIASAPEAHQLLAEKLRSARAGGARVVLLSMGTVLTRMFARLGAAHLAFLRRLYTTLAASALHAGAVVVASTCDRSAAELGVDEAALGPAARDRVFAMPFVPQPFLFAHGLVDVMLMHGGANTFHEAVVSGIPVLVSPGFGDQSSVAQAANRLGVGVCVESIMNPDLESVPLDRVAAEILPEMLAPGVTRWKATAMTLAARIREENGLDAAEALVLASR